MSLINSKNLALAAWAWLTIFTLYEIVDSYQWMTQTAETYTAHPALGTFAGYEAAIQGDGALRRLPIIMGKWVGMAKFFLVGALLTVLLFGNNRARAFVLAWNFVCLMVMSFALYPTLDQITAVHPDDFSNGFSKMWALETIVGVLCGFFSVLAISADVMSRREAKVPSTSNT